MAIVDWMNSLILKIFGWHRYRVKFTYKDKRGRVVFDLIKTINVSRQRYIDTHRDIKVAMGPIANIEGIEKSWLCNGNLYVDPLCYLGRWR